jgi:anti-sigma regulatory factor (Ser/Thr protein kinase)
MRNDGEPGVLQSETQVLRESFDLATRSTSAAEARHRGLAWLTRNGVARQAADAAVLVIGEFVANAVVHGGGRVVSCDLQLSDSLLRVDVTDQGTGQTSPVVRQAAADDVSGRGLLLVSAVSEAWGAFPAVPCGWTVWAIVRTIG